MKIVIYEHVSGGGYAEQPIPPSVLSEGFAMLRCAVEDFKAAGHEVTVLIDARLSKLNPPLEANFTVPVFYAKENEKILKIISKINDAIYVIAPETGQILQSIVELEEDTGKISLNCTSEAVGVVTDKAALYENLQKNGFPTPKTLLFNITDSLTHVKQTINREINYPVVFKPADGAGCSGLSIVKEDAQVEKAVSKIKSESKSIRFIAQEFINGISASVSLLSTGQKAKALSLNKQNINFSGPDGNSSYEGGIVPFNYWLKQDVFNVAEKVVEAFSGLRGYVGVDFVLTEHKAFVVDVNPRLTTSYVGLRRVASFNVAEALVDAVLKGKLPSKPENHGAVCFSKIETTTPTPQIFQKAAKLDTVVSPLFPLNNNEKSCAFIISEGKSLDEAKVRLEEAKNHLLNIFT